MFCHYGRGPLKSLVCTFQSFIYFLLFEIVLNVGYLYLDTYTTKIY